MTIIKQAARWWDALEHFFIASLGTLLFIALFIVLPFSIVRDHFPAHPALAIATVIGSAAAILTAARDIIRRRMTALGAVVVGLWFLCVLSVALLA